MAKVMKKDKDGFRHVTNPGATNADIKRGYCEGMHSDEATGSGETKPAETMEDFAGGFLGRRGKTWER